MEAWNKTVVGSKYLSFIPLQKWFWEFLTYEHYLVYPVEVNMDFQMFAINSANLFPCQKFAHKAVHVDIPSNRIEIYEERLPYNNMLFKQI